MKRRQQQQQLIQFNKMRKESRAFVEEDHHGKFDLHKKYLKALSLVNRKRFHKYHIHSTDNRTFKQSTFEILLNWNCKNAIILAASISFQPQNPKIQHIQIFRMEKMRGEDKNINEKTRKRLYS